MPILLEPNVAYLILVGGFLLAILAVLAPGTIILEVSSVFAILLAGYAVYNLPINWWALVILLVGVFPFLVALRKSGRLIYLAVSLAALVVGSVFLFRTENGLPAVNLALAVVVSLLTIGFLWLAASKTMVAMALKPAQNLDRLIGAIGEAKTPIYQEGTVYVGGENWSAHSQVNIPTHARVKVLRRSGFTLEVEPVEPAQPTNMR
jgi:membrane-bound serine protease (ClpP class)